MSTKAKNFFSVYIAILIVVSIILVSLRVSDFIDKSTFKYTVYVLGASVNIMCVGLFGYFYAKFQNR